MKTALITGITGQDGAYLAKFLLQKGYRVVGTTRSISENAQARLRILRVENNIELIALDLCEADALGETLKKIKPDEIYNLAAQSLVSTSWERPVQTTDVNSTGVVRLLDAIKTFCSHARFYQASSSEMFGQARVFPQSEETPFYPRSPYAASKTFGHFITVNFRESFGMHTSSGILFNHESPLRGTEFVTRKISRGLASIALKKGGPISLGTLDVKRDWGFAGDYVEGMVQMLQQPVGSDYVLATGVATTVRSFVEYVGTALGMQIVWQGNARNEIGIDRKTNRTVVELDDKFIRPAEADFLFGNATKARRVLGWQPKVSVVDLAQMMAKADYDALS